MQTATSHSSHQQEQVIWPPGWGSYTDRENGATWGSLTPSAVLAPPATLAPPDALTQALDAFLLDAEARQLSPSTIRFYKQQLQPFLSHLQTKGVTTPEAILAHHIRAYLVSLQQRGLKAHSVHAAARSVRAFCSFMKVEDLLPSNPMRKVRMPRLPKEIPPAFSQDDVNKLITACTNVRDRAIVLFLLDTGCRAAEFTALDVEDIDLAAGIVQVRKGKGNRGRTTYFGDSARAALEARLAQRKDHKPADPLWVSMTTGTRLTDSGLRLMLRRLGKRAGVKHCHPHTFRRTFALWSLRAGMNIYALQRIMGHSDLTILRRYLALTEQDLQTAHRRFGAVDSMLSASPPNMHINS